MRQQFNGSTILLRLVLGIALLLSALAAAHPGGLNAQRCHNNRKSGDYHCHRSKGPARAPAASYAPGGGGSSFAPSSTPAAPMRAGPAGLPAGGRPFRNCSEARAKRSGSRAAPTDGQERETRRRFNDTNDRPPAEDVWTSTQSRVTRSETTSG
jgi:hypothetical protein